MFYLLSVLSMIGYGLQTSLLAHVSRKVDPLDMTVYRNVSFILTLSPLLLFTSGAHILAIFRHWPQLLLMGFAAVLALWGMFFAFRSLPIGIATSVRSATVAVFITTLSYIFFQELISFKAAMLIILAIGGTVFLSTQKNHMTHLNEKTVLGFVVLLLTAIPSALSVFVASWLARQPGVDPFVAGYFWEVSIGLAAVISVTLRSILLKKRFQWIGPKDAGKVALAAWPTLIGTGAYTLAVTQGPIAIVWAIGLASSVVATLVAHFFFREKLTLKQWMGIVVVLIAVGGMKFV